MNRSFLKNFSLISSLLILFSISPAAISQDAAAFLGTWDGTIDVMGQSLQISVSMTLDEEGNIRGTIDVPAQGASGIALSSFEIDGKKITFMIEGPPGDPTFTGELDEAGKKISGGFSQGGAEGTFTLEKK